MNINPEIKNHLVKIVITSLFVAAVWFVSFAIFPENQVVKLDIGDPSPRTFIAPKYIEVEDTEATLEKKEIAENSVEPIFVTDDNSTLLIINDIADIFLEVLEVRTVEESTSEEGDIESGDNESEVIITTLSVGEQIKLLQNSIDFSNISINTIEALVTVSNLDLNNKTSFISELEAESRKQVLTIMSLGIGEEELNDTRRAIIKNPAQLSLPSELYLEISQARLESAVAEIISENLVANKKLDQTAWDKAKVQATSMVEPVFVKFFEDEVVVSQGEKVSNVEYQALASFGYLSGASRTIQNAAVPIFIAVFLMIYGIFWRFNDSIWKFNNQYLLLLTLILFSSVFLRGTSYFSQQYEIEFLIYAVPISFVGVVSSALLNLRATLVIALASSFLALAGGGNLGLVAMGGLGCIQPAIFLSENVDIRELKQKIVYISLLQPVIAYGVAYFLKEDGSIVRLVVYALIGGIMANLAAFSSITYIETGFRLTTNFRLSELADRNHPALRFLEERALGTFNHSLVVGTLADRACTKIEANSQLARAMAYFHDLGKTVNPSMFVENQFSFQNPHDKLSPLDSAKIIRDHVPEGIEIAKRYRIPEVVSNGILEHHGDAVMRFFYEKEKQYNDNVDRKLFRHEGRRPTTKESAVVMLADSIEGSSRARFTKEDATPTKISELIEEIFNEKINDNQLNSSPLTLQEIQIIKESFQESIEGLYHQRVLYPEITESASSEEE
tara:strand:- start:61 stop:2253 length:2193 start_codon:yes stop_codon:yes gene_type:complete